jgi:hypothetical protein
MMLVQPDSTSPHSWGGGVAEENKRKEADISNTAEMKNNPLNLDVARKAFMGSLLG